MFADQLAGNGNYVVYATRQRSGAGSAYEVGARTTVAVPSGVTSQMFPTIALLAGATDVIKVWLLGLAGDTTTPNTIVDVSEEYINVDASGNPTPNDSAGITSILAAVDTEVAAIKAKTDLIPASPAAVGNIPTANENADALLKRDWTSVTGEASRSVLQALRFLRNKWELTGVTLSVKGEDDVTEKWSAAVTTQAGAEPITGTDPT